MHIAHSRSLTNAGVLDCTGSSPILILTLHLACNRLAPYFQMLVPQLNHQLLVIYDFGFAADSREKIEWLIVWCYQVNSGDEMPLNLLTNHPNEIFSQ